MIPTDELRELLADYNDARRENETSLGYATRMVAARRKLSLATPSLAAEVLRLRDAISGYFAAREALKAQEPNP